LPSAERIAVVDELLLPFLRREATTLLPTISNASIGASSVVDQSASASANSLSSSASLSASLSCAVDVDVGGGDDGNVEPPVWLIDPPETHLFEDVFAPWPIRFYIVGADDRMSYIAAPKDCQYSVSELERELESLFVN
jgi:hypothetical protein